MCGLPKPHLSWGTQLAPLIIKPMPPLPIPPVFANQSLLLTAIPSTWDSNLIQCLQHSFITHFLKFRPGVYCGSFEAVHHTFILLWFDIKHDIWHLFPINIFTSCVGDVLHEYKCWCCQTGNISFWNPSFFLTSTLFCLWLACNLCILVHLMFLRWSCKFLSRNCVVSIPHFAPILQTK